MTVEDYRLDEVCQVTMGQAPAGDSYNVEGKGEPLIAGAGDFDGTLPAAKKFTTAPSKMCVKGDIVIGIRASIGDKVWADRAYCLGRGVAGLRAGPQLEAHYLWHWLTFAKRELVAKGRGATFLQVNRADIGELRIPVPALDEQRRIAKILDQADELQAKRRRTLTLLDDLTQSIFLDMFGADAVDQWTLGDALASAEVFTDGDWVESKDQDPDGEIRLTQLADVGDGLWLDKSSRFLTLQKSVDLRCTLLREGDVLVARMPYPLGRACVFPGDANQCVTVVDVCVIRVDRNVLVPEWLSACINSPQVRRQISRLATGTTRSRISRGNLKTVLIPKVSLQRQLSFASTIAQLKRLRSDLDVSLASMLESNSSARLAAFLGAL